MGVSLAALPSAPRIHLSLGRGTPGRLPFSDSDHPGGAQGRPQDPIPGEAPDFLVAISHCRAMPTCPPGLAVPAARGLMPIPL